MSRHRRLRRGRDINTNADTGLRLILCADLWAHSLSITFGYFFFPLVFDSSSDECNGKKCYFSWMNVPFSWNVIPSISIFIHAYAERTSVCVWFCIGTPSAHYYSHNWKRNVRVHNAGIQCLKIKQRTNGIWCVSNAHTVCVGAE